MAGLRRTKVKVSINLMVVMLMCYHCKKEGHTRKLYPKHLKDHGGKDNGNATIIQDDF